MTRFVLISGCSGGGKSTLLKELARRGHPVVEEPGGRIVTEELASGGSALPWIDPMAFGRRLLAVALADHERMASTTGRVFFDRGLIDAASFLAHLTDAPMDERVHTYRYHHRVFLAPPWSEIYVTDAGRRHGLAEAIVEYDRLARDYPALGYAVTLIPKIGVAERADFILSYLKDEQG